MPTLQARLPKVIDALLTALNAPGDALAPAALAIARVEYPALDPVPYLQHIERLGEGANARVERSAARAEDRIATLNAYVYEELAFSGNREQYEDPRNSFLNEVIDRRLGIPISLAVIYLELGRRAGLRLEGVNFPGHFLVRAPGAADADDIIIDPFHAGARLSEIDCRQLLRQQIGEDAAFDPALLATATRQQIIVRMLVNLKRLYVRMRSFPQARFISDLLLAVDPSAVGELRDRGLLAYHMEDFASALRDLEQYLRMMPKPDVESAEAREQEAVFGDEREEASEEASESSQIWEHVKTLRRRVAGFN
ncbi:MAG TPA: transglutaminase-like domain-containing protein [Vicinamibacterales bacterium]|nr:transglutaminase-like domain-containing protein [Vicinamibacterales bacterium]